VASPPARIRLHVLFLFSSDTHTYIFTSFRCIYNVQCVSHRKENELYELVLFINTNIVGTRLVHVFTLGFSYLSIFIFFLYIYVCTYTYPRILHINVFMYPCMHVRVRGICVNEHTYIYIYIYILFENYEGRDTVIKRKEEKKTGEEGQDRYAPSDRRASRKSKRSGNGDRTGPR